MMRTDVTDAWKQYLRQIGINPPRSAHLDEIESNWANDSLRGNENRTAHFNYYQLALDGKTSQINCNTSQLATFVNRVKDFKPLTDGQIDDYSRATLPDIAMSLLNREGSKKNRIYLGLVDIVYLDHTLGAQEDVLRAKVQLLKDSLDDRKQLIDAMSSTPEEKESRLEKYIRDCAEEESHILLEACRDKRKKLRDEAREYVMESLLVPQESASMKFAREIENKLHSALRQLDPESRFELAADERQQLTSSFATALRSSTSTYPNESPVNITLNLDASTTNVHEEYHRGRDTITAQEGSNVNTGEGDQYTESGKTE